MTTTSPLALTADQTGPVTPSDLWDAGKATERGIEVYGEGDCWALAWHVAQQTGGRIHVLGDWNDTRYWEHVVVEVSGHDATETYLDITGPVTRDALTRSWHRALEPIPDACTRDLDTYVSALGAGWVWLDETEGHSLTAAVATALCRTWAITPSASVRCESTSRPRPRGESE